MADSGAALKELEIVLSHTAVSHYTIVSSLCLYVYDFLLTFPMEVEYFWNSPRSFVKVMFFWNRYLTFPIIVFLAFTEINRLPTASLCELSGAWLIMRAKYLVVVVRQVVLARQQASFSRPWCVLVGRKLRIHALYAQNRALKIVLSILFFMAVASELGIAIAQLVTLKGAIPFLVDPLSLCVGKIPKFLIGYPVPMMVFDTILLILVVYKAYLIQREEATTGSDKAWAGTRLLRIMFRDSLVYFACTVGVNLFNVLVWSLAPEDLFTIGTAWGVTVPVMAAGRILFNMRVTYHHSEATMDGELGTEFQVARRSSKGQTVWSAPGSSGGDVGSSVEDIYNDSSH
ncbi:hypothetical protein C8R46DRAFT_1216677 [Mycena filopes]|nr:hypothetical protein C8R46DRAFT_1216677 [Mycena filopes]